MSTAVIPNRPIFRAQEVCELADVQPYVLRSWEAEFPDLGHARTPSGPRVYRRGDVERVLRIKHLLFVDGLTLAGARRRLTEEGVVANTEPVRDADVVAMLDEQARQQLRDVRRGLNWILGVLSGHGVTREEIALTADGPPAQRKAVRREAHARRATERPKPRQAATKAARKAVRGKRR